VPPGEYTAVAVEGLIDVTSPGFRSALAARGIRVKAEAGATETVDLRGN